MTTRPRRRDLLLPLLLWAAPAAAEERSGEARGLDGDHLRVEIEAPALRPGGAVALYVEEARPDGQGGWIVGLRYAGDARLVWVGAGLVELVLAEGAAAPGAGQVILGDPRGLPPTPPWTPPALAEARPPEPPAPEAPAPAPPPPVERPARDRHLSAAGSVHGDPRSSALSRGLAAGGGWAGDGYGTGAGLATLAWAWRPERGPGLVVIGLEGLRGQRWAQGDETEPWAREAVAATWLWTRMDTPGVGLALFGGLGLGVDAEGPAAATLLGLRTGHPDASRIEVQWEHLGRLGDRVTLDGRVALADPLRIGARGRLGDLPRHDGDALQRRADGAALISWDVSERLTLTAAGGLGAYDLLWADAGPVFDGALELRW